MMPFRAPSATFAITLFLIGLSVTTLPADASTGGEEPPPEFNSPWGPVRPTADLAIGNLGVVEASWWRKPLLLAWYRFNGLDLPAGALDAFDYAERTGGYYDGPPGLKAWVADAKAIAPELAPDVEPRADANLVSGNAWDRFENCPNESWEQARRTLADRLKAWGAKSTALRDWLAAQHRVFARCPLGPGYFRSDLPGGQRINPDYAKQFILPDMSLVAPPSGTPELLAKDRAYQMAAALLYEGRYKEAERGFLAIAKDTASPWREWGMYLALRARLRAIQIVAPAPTYDPCQAPECVKARSENLALRQAEAARLRADVRNAIAEATKTGNPAELQRLADLDSLVGARLDPALRFRELATQLMRPDLNAAAFRHAATDYLHLHRQFPPSEPLGEWLSGLINGRDPTGSPCRSATSPATSGGIPPTPGDVQCLRRQWSEESLKRFHQQPTHYAWLFSAAALAGRDDPHLESLRKALAGVPDNHTGAASFMLHRLRLGERDEGLRLAAALLNRSEVKADYSARNRVREYRLWHADKLTEFWTDGPREVGTAFDRDTLLRSAPGDASAAPVWGWDYDARWILNYELPHAALIETATSSGWPENLRGPVAKMAWSRAILRQDATAARQTLAVLSASKDEPLLPHIARLQAIEDDRTFLIESGLLAYGATLSSGCRIAVPKVDKYTPPYEESVGDLKHYYGRFAKRLLSPAAFADWQRERKTLEALGDQDSAWMRNVLEFAAAFPDDDRVPDLLRQAVFLTRLNWCADPSAGNLSKKAFELLKRKYPKSKAARTTKYWFNPRT